MFGLAGPQSGQREPSTMHVQWQVEQNSLLSGDLWTSEIMLMP
jgi:hypothetical protein